MTNAGVGGPVIRGYPVELIAAFLIEAEVFFSDVVDLPVLSSFV